MGSSAGRGSSCHTLLCSRRFRFLGLLPAKGLWAPLLVEGPVVTHCFALDGFAFWASCQPKDGELSCEASIIFVCPRPCSLVYQCGGGGRTLFYGSRMERRDIEAECGEAE